MRFPPVLGRWTGRGYGAGGVDPRICQTFAASPAEPGELPLWFSRFVPGGVFEVIKQLPGGNEPEYRIKSANERHERVARESELIKA